MMNVKIASLIAVAASAAAVTAGPLFIFEQSNGDFTVTNETANDRTIDFSTTVTFEVGGLGIVSVDGSFLQTFLGGNPDTLAGTAVFEGAPGDTLSVAFAGVIFEDGFDSFSATWELTGSTGAYAQYTSGSGNNSGSFFFTDDDTGSMFAIFQGTLVPAPGALALAGVAGVLASRRRRA